MDKLQNLEKKIGEPIDRKGIAGNVEKLSAKGQLDKDGMNDKLLTIRKQDKTHQRSLEELSMDLSKSQGVSLGRIEETAKKTEQKFSEIMEIYLGKDPDSSEALEFLCLAEAGGITHYEILNGMASEIKNENLVPTCKEFLERRKIINSHTPN